MLLIFVSYSCLELDANIEDVFNFYTDLSKLVPRIYSITVGQDNLLIKY